MTVRTTEPPVVNVVQNPNVGVNSLATLISNYHGGGRKEMPIISMDHLSNLILELRSFQEKLRHPIPSSIDVVMDRHNRLWRRSPHDKTQWVILVSPDGVPTQSRPEPALLEECGPLKAFSRTGAEYEAAT